jgi:hypothetical protein
MLSRAIWFPFNTKEKILTNNSKTQDTQKKKIKKKKSLN